MAFEIERKFLVRDPAVLDGLTGVDIEQGYLSDGNMTVRVRVAGDRAYLTLKSRPRGIRRSEFEYEIPLADGQALLAEDAVLGRLSKTRYLVEVSGHAFEVDRYHGVLQGLLTAELELEHEEQPVPNAPWLGEEVSHDPRYSNEQLAKFGLPR
jgi:adenylate cyclase